MAFSALSLTTTTGVQGRPFAAVLNGLQAGSTIEMSGDGSPGFSYVNGRFSSDRLPYPVSTLVFDEIRPGEGRKQWRFDIQAAGAPVLTVAADGTTSYSGAGGAPTAQSGTASAAGPVYTVSRLLGSSSTLALISGTNSNLTLNATTGVISAASTIAVGASQTAKVSETLGDLRVDYPVVITGVSAGTPTPTPAPILLRTMSDLSSVQQQDTGPAFAAPAGSGTVITVDKSVTYQSFVGVGAAITDSAVFNLLALPADVRAAILQESFGTNGMSTVRICIGRSDFSRDTNYYTYNDTNTDGTNTAFSIQKDIDFGIVGILQQIKAINPDLRIIAMPWTPPVFMKDSGSFISGNIVETASNFNFYADYFLKFVQAYAALGLPIYAVAPQNEPNANAKNFPCCGWTGAQLASFIGNYLGPVFRNNNITTEIWSGDAAWADTDDRATAPLADANARQFVKGAAYHAYPNGSSTTQFTKQTTDLASYPGIPAHMTEFRTFLADSYDLSTAQMAGDAFIGSMRNKGASVTLWNYMLFGPNGTPYQNSPGRRGVVQRLSDGSLVRSAEFHIMAHFGRYVKRGAVRIDSTSPAVGRGGGDLETVAWLNPDGSVAVFIWNGANSAKVASLFDKASGLTSDIAIPARQFVTATYKGLADIPVNLGTLTLNQTNATAGSAFTTAILGRTNGSTITATSSDGTSLTVSGSNVSGTFSAAGSKTITLTETLARATNSPKSSTVTLTVAAAPPAGSALAMDSTGSGNSNGAASSLTWTHTVASTANLLVVSLGMNVPSSNSTDVPVPTSVTAGGVAMTKLVSSPSTGSSGMNRVTEIWYLQNPPTGAISIAASTSSTTATQPNSVGGSVSFINALATPFGDVQASPSTTAGGTASRGVTVPVQNGRAIVLSSFAGRSTATTATLQSNMTAIVNARSGTNTLCAMAYQPDTGAISQYTMPAADQNTVVAVPVLSA